MPLAQSLLLVASHQQSFSSRKDRTADAVVGAIVFDGRRDYLDTMVATFTNEVSLTQTMRLGGGVGGEVGWNLGENGAVSLWEAGSLEQGLPRWQKEKEIGNILQYCIL